METEWTPSDEFLGWHEEKRWLRSLSRWRFASVQM
jgi:hypothetical protein